MLPNPDTVEFPREASLSTASASRCQEGLYQTLAEAKPIVILFPAILRDVVWADDYEESRMPTERWWESGFKP